MRTCLISLFGCGNWRFVDVFVLFLCSAAITLHNNYLNFKDSQSLSTSRCVNATRSILASYYSLSETSLDITRLHPFVTVRLRTASPPPAAHDR